MHLADLQNFVSESDGILTKVASDIRYNYGLFSDVNSTPQELIRNFPAKN
jgi:hypothetical protein